MDNDIGVQAIIEAAKNVKDDELWNLDVTLAALIFPYMKKFREVRIGHPSPLRSDEAWDEILDKIIFSFEAIANDKGNPYDSWIEKAAYDNYELEIQKGLGLFGVWFRSLWI